MGVPNFMEGSLKLYEIGDPGPQFHMKMETPHFHLTPAFATPLSRLTVSGPTMLLGSLDNDANASLVLRRESSPMAQTAMKLLQIH